jgi:hypothetical protein
VTEEKVIPQFVVRDEQNDYSTQVRVQRISNGFVVRTGSEPVFYATIEQAAEAVRLGLIAARWPQPKGN